MKIKTFKNQIKNENYDIPDVLEKIKPFAYTTKYHTEPKKHVFFNNLLQLVPVMTVFTICLLVLLNLDRTVPLSVPKIFDDNSLEPGEIQPPIITEFDIFNSYLDNSESHTMNSTDALPNFSTGESITKECSSDDYCMWKIENDINLTFVVDEKIFNYLLTYIRNNPNCTLIDTVDNVKNEFSIPDEKLYTISDAYNYIKSNNLYN